MTPLQELAWKLCQEDNMGWEDAPLHWDALYYQVQRYYEDKAREEVKNDRTRT